MKREHYLSESERRAIDAKYGRDTLFGDVYGALKKVALQAMYERKGHQFLLAGEDLFYHVMYVIDQIINEEDAKIQVSYATDLWQDTNMHILEVKEPEEAELNYATTLIVQSAYHLLSIGARFRYWDVCDALLSSINDNDPGNQDALEPIMHDKLWSQDVNDCIRQWFTDYMHAETFASDDMNLMLDAVVSDDPVADWQNRYKPQQLRANSAEQLIADALNQQTNAIREQTAALTAVASKPSTSINQFAKDSVRFEAGSTMNGDVRLNE